MLNFSSMLAQVRVSLNLTVTELSRRTGFCRKQIQQWERGNILPPDGENLHTLCKAMGASSEQREALLKAAVEVHVNRLRERYRNPWGEVV
ncbi:MAG: helix-turn-helix domain-containing protein [Pseudobdellovibrionaceae bacterium]|nr:helix-turn-helix domain-containing protein [Pseudobdellovibrionaceae bacterium]